MIRINLLGEKVDNTAVYTLQSIAFASVLFLTTATCFVVYGSAEATLATSQTEASLLENQLVKLREKTKRVENLEKNKVLLRDKLMTIARLKVKKNAPVRILADVTEAIPERAWLSAINQKSGALEFKGIAQDPQTVSMFMKNLEVSSFFANVELSFSRQKIRDSVAIQEFALLAKLRNPLEMKEAANAAKDKKKAEKDKVSASPKSEPAEEAVKTEALAIVDQD